jgi:hypothetical protein
MPNLSNQDVQLGQLMFTSSVTQQHPLGQRGWTQDGRAFVYAGAAAAGDLVAGNVIQGAAPIAGNLAQTPAAAALGATAITITAITTTVVANQYAEGYMQVDTTPGNGYTYTIRDHLAATGGTALVINLLAEDGIQGAALTTASRVGLASNLYMGVIQCPTAKTGPVVGVAAYVIKASQFGWLQTWGPCSVLINGTPAVTAPVINGGTTAGSVDVWTTAAQATASYLGEMMQVGVSTKNNFVFLKIRP